MNPSGSARGKRSNPAYQCVTAWSRRDTYSQVKKRLFDEDEEFWVLCGWLLKD